MLGQALLTRRMGKSRVIAETGAGQHGVATATAAALIGLECTVYMGEEDTQRQALNVARMQLLGAEVVPVTAGSRTLKDAINEAMRDWVTTVDRTHYVLGTVTGPAPFPTMVRDFHAVIGREAREQILAAEGRLPDALVACVGGGSNAMGLFSAFIDDPDVQLRGYEAGGEGVATGRHASRFAAGSPGVLHGARTYVMQDEWGQTLPSHSISAGLDYPGVGPEHSWLHDTGRAVYEPVDDTEAMEAFAALCRTEGIIPAIETAHALAGRHAAGPRARPRGRHHRQPVRSRRQGRRDGGAVVRHRPLRDAGAVSAGLSEVFARTRAEGRAALIGYLPAGFPTPEQSVALINAMVEAGVDIIEVGLPYSDPLMDGPDIQAAVDLALRAGTTTDTVIDVVAQVSAAGGTAGRHVLLEPDRALRGRPVRGAPRRGRRRTA